MAADGLNLPAFWLEKLNAEAEPGSETAQETWARVASAMQVSTALHRVLMTTSKVTPQAGTQRSGKQGLVPLVHFVLITEYHSLDNL